MRRIRGVFLVPAAVILFGCEAAPTRPTAPTAISRLPRPLTNAETTLVAADNHFAFALLGAVAAGAPAGANVFLSPVSVAMALGMTVNGAAGATRDSMLSALRLAGQPLAQVDSGYRGLIGLLGGLDPLVTFTLANGIWYRPAITPAAGFLEAARTFFDADVQGLDFSSPGAAQTINDWVSTATGGKITSIVPSPLPDSAILFLIDAIDFKGSWTQQFDPSLTRTGSFTLRSGGTVAATMMTHGEPAPARIYRGDGVTVVDLPYGGRAWSMTIVLPDTPAGIDSLPAALTADRWSGWMSGLDSGGVILTMPKFTLTFGAGLDTALTALGMGTAFCEGGDADFSAAYPGTLPGEVCISEVRHKTYVDVDEEGTEAAAATSVEIIPVAVRTATRLVVDRPFLVAIRERLTGTILFLGRVMDPTAS